MDVSSNTRRTSARLSAEDRLVFECEARANGFARVAGVDEAGRGPLAGPIVAGAVVLGASLEGLELLDDSKRLRSAQREDLFKTLSKGGHAIGIGLIEAAEIDKNGIQTANYAAMLEAVRTIAEPPDFLLVDGFSIPGCTIPHMRLIKGDQRSLSIAAASIIAKVTRDRIMDELDQKYPGYGFAEHKGYATAAHLVALEHLGPSPVHRKSFAPIAGRPVSGELFASE